MGITQDGGGCANVKTAIDTLITTINDIIAPTSEDFNTAANRPYFNRNYIVQEITGLTNAEFTYQLNNVNYSALNTAFTADLELIILSIISDLQTGGNSSTIKSIETYINANLTLKDISDILLATIYSIEQLKIFGERAVKNLLYDQFDSVTGDQHAAQYSSASAYRDSITPTDINQVVYRIRDLVDEADDFATAEMKQEVHLRIFSIIRTTIRKKLIPLLPHNLVLVHGLMVTSLMVWSRILFMT